VSRRNTGERQIRHFYRADPVYGHGVGQGLVIDAEDIEQAA
jgi:catalase